MILKKNDFIEIEFTGRIKGTGEIFDSNIENDLKETGLQKQESKPFIFALGQGMFLQGIDEFLVGKPEKAAEYKIDLSSDRAFGPRRSELVQLMPMRVFAKQNINPVPGAMFNFDGKIGKVLSVSGGRVMIDFNNPIAGKDVVYDVKLLRKIEDDNEKIKSFINFLFLRDLAFEITKEKIILEVEKAMSQFVQMFEEKFKELFGKGLEVKEIAEKATKEIEKEVGKENLAQVRDISNNSDTTK
jgi:FKBP-type peptidyl-prolyl cis-trans isomerase 2